MTTEIDAEGLRKKIESDPDEGEIGVGFEMFTPEAEAALERMAFAALPRWARDELTALRARTSEAEPVADPSFPAALSDSEVRIWINTCNHDPARQALRQLLAYRVRGVSQPLPTPASDDLVEAAYAAGVEAAAKWHESEAERIRLLALDSDNPGRMHTAQDDHISHAAFIRDLAAMGSTKR